jgi:Domain of unknown function (DUF4406)
VDVFTGVRRPYISGQISGLTWPEYSENFARAEALLISHGLDPINPLKVQACETEDCTEIVEAHPGGLGFLHSWKCYMKYDIQQMIMEADSIAMLPNWPHSRGAKLEMSVARGLEFPLFYISRGYKTVQKGVGIS